MDSKYEHPQGAWWVARSMRAVANIGIQQTGFVRSVRIGPLLRLADHPAQRDPLARAYWRAELAYWRAVADEMNAAQLYALNGAHPDTVSGHTLRLRPVDPELSEANYARVWETYHARRAAGARVGAAACALWTARGYSSAASVCAAPDERPWPPRSGEWP